MVDEKDKLLLSYGADRLRQSDENYMPTNTKLLDIRQQSLIREHFSRNGSCDLFFYGGYPEAERTLCLFFPKGYPMDEEVGDYFDKNIEDNPLSLVRVSKDRFSGTMTHRDYLGALMGLGVSREAVGDLIVHESGCDIVIMKQLASFVCENLTSVGRASVKPEVLSLSEIKKPQLTLEEKFCSVASMRLDVVVGAVYGLSRSASAEAIGTGLVYVNGQQAVKTDFKLSEGDVLVLRGRGKSLIERQNGQSKKGRLHLIVQIYK